MWLSIWSTYGGRLAGLLAALFLGFVYLLAGFWDMAFVALLLWIGYTIGKRRDEGAGPLVQWQQIGNWLTDRFGSFK